MERLIKDEVKKIINMLTEFIYLMNTEEEIKFYDGLIPVLLIIRGEITRTLNHMNEDEDFRARSDDTIYTHFIHIEKALQQKIIDYLIKDIKNNSFIKLETTKDIIIF